MKQDLNVLSKLALLVAVQELEDVDGLKRRFQRHAGISDEVYSYLIYATHDGGQLLGWRVEFLFSQTDCYNCIDKVTAIDEICDKMQKNYESSERVIGYRQPPLEVLVETYEPLVRKLARREADHWKELEFEDLCQMCRLVICTLYDKGYYVHKNLIRRSFVSYVLMHIRKDKFRPVMVSLSDLVGSEDGISPLDYIADDEAEMALHQAEEAEYCADVLQQKRSLIVDLIGQRQYDQLVREYGNKTTTNAGRKTVFKLKTILKEMGISECSFGGG